MENIVKTNVLYNYDVVRVFSQINNDAGIDDVNSKKHFKKVIELWLNSTLYVIYPKFMNIF